MATAAIEARHAWHSRPVMVFAGQADTHRETGEDYQTRPLATLFTIPPGNRPKGKGFAFIPSSYADFDGREHAAQRERGSFVALTGDVDKGDHSLGRMRELVERFADGAAHVIYTTAHARPGNMRWRVILPLAEPLAFPDWHDAQTALFEFMEAEGVPMDRALARAGQPVYLPNVPPVHVDSGEPLRNEAGWPLYYAAASTGTDAPGLRIDSGSAAEALDALRRRREADDLLRAQLREQAERRRASRAAKHGDRASVIDSFNASVTIADLLPGYGYEQSPRNRDDWRSPHQTSGSYATRIIGDKWVSLSGSDAAAGVGPACAAGCYGDPFDLFLHYEHGGDRKAAWRQLCDEQGRSGSASPLGSAEPPHRYSEDPGWQEAPKWGEGDGQPEAAEQEQRDPGLLPLIDMAAWQGDPPARVSLWGDWLPIRQTTMLTGRGGIGKSLLEQMLCTCIALGRPFLGMETRQTNTLYVTCEDDADELWRRQDAINDALAVSRADVIGKLHLAALTGAPDVALANFGEGGRLQTTERWRQLEATCEALNVGLYAFDNATDAMAGDLNDIHQVAEFVNLLTGLAIRRDGVAMILHHPNKAGDDWLGSVAWHNKVRSRLIVEDPDEEDNHDPDARVIRNPKANYGPQGGKIAFRWNRGAFVRDEDLPPDYAAEMTANIRAAAENKRLLDCLAKATEERRTVSVSPSAPNYLPRVFAKMTTGKGIGERGFAAAMERLLHLGTIANSVPVYKRDNRTWAMGVGLVEGAQDPAQTPA